MKASTTLILIILALCIFWAYGLYIVISWAQCKSEIKKYRNNAKLEMVDIRPYNCPPNLSDYQCETFIRFAIANGIDVNDFLLSRWDKK